MALPVAAERGCGLALVGWVGLVLVLVLVDFGCFWLRLIGRRDAIYVCFVSLELLSRGLMEFFGWNWRHFLRWWFPSPPLVCVCVCVCVCARAHVLTCSRVHVCTYARFICVEKQKISQKLRRRGKALKRQQPKGDKASVRVVSCPPVCDWVHFFVVCCFYFFFY